jgi:undecaprenyl-diphosphatase
MINEILYGIIQAITEFLPISSSGHLALVSNLIAKPDLFYFTLLHLASLVAVLIFTRKEIYYLITFKREYRKLWIYLIIATIPALVFGLLFQKKVEASFSSLLFLGIAFIFTGFILFFTKFTSIRNKFNWKNSIFVGIFQAIALFPGVSRSGMTISSSLFAGIDREKAARFSFLLFIPVSLGAFLLEVKEVGFHINSSLFVGAIVCVLLSLVFLNLLIGILKKDKFWLFSFYCWLIGVITLLFYFKVI